MTEILWHGRGGQGAFTAARLAGCAYALKNDSCHALAFPAFGPERRGAPIRAFTKLSGMPIGDRSEIERADFSIFLDDTLYSDSAFSELKENGIILLNTKHETDDLRIRAIDADSIALEILGVPIANTVMLGALAALTDMIDLSDIEKAIRACMPAKLHEKNISAVKAAFYEISGAREIY